MKETLKKRELIVPTGRKRNVKCDKHSSPAMNDGYKEPFAQDSILRALIASVSYRQWGRGSARYWANRGRPIIASWGTCSRDY